MSIKLSKGGKRSLVIVAFRIVVMIKKMEVGASFSCQRQSK